MFGLEAEIYILQLEVEVLRRVWG